MIEILDIKGSKMDCRGAYLLSLSKTAVTIESLDKEYRAAVNDALVGDLLTGENNVPPSRRNLSSC